MLFLTIHFASILAYLDPGSGSFLLQLAIAAVVGIAVVLRTQWGRIKRLFGRGDPPGSEDSDSDDEQQ